MSTVRMTEGAVRTGDATIDLASVTDENGANVVVWIHDARIKTVFSMTAAEALAFSSALRSHAQLAINANKGNYNE